MINSSQSIKNGKTIFSFLKAVGTGGISDINEARRSLQKTIHDPSKQDLIAQHVEGQREHFDNVSICQRSRYLSPRLLQAVLFGDLADH